MDLVQTFHTQVIPVGLWIAMPGMGRSLTPRRQTSHAFASRADVALSTLLTAVSSLITTFIIPLLTVLAMVTLVYAVILKITPLSFMYMARQWIAGDAVKSARCGLQELC